MRSHSQSSPARRHVRDLLGDYEKYREWDDEIVREIKQLQEARSKALKMMQGTAAEIEDALTVEEFRVVCTSTMLPDKRLVKSFPDWPEGRLWEVHAYEDPDEVALTNEFSEFDCIADDCDRHFGGNCKRVIGFSKGIAQWCQDRNTVRTPGVSPGPYSPPVVITDTLIREAVTRRLDQEADYTDRNDEDEEEEEEAAEEEEDEGDMNSIPY